MAMSMSNYFNDPYDNDLRNARSREEYEYLKAKKRHEMEMYASMNMTPPVTMPAPPVKPSHLNQKLLLTKGA